MTNSRRTDNCGRSRSILDRFLENRTAIASTWLQKHLDVCPACRERMSRYNRFSLAMKLLKAQPHSPQLLKNANTRAINMLKHSARELPLAEKLRQKMPKPAFISGLGKYSHAVTHVAACIAVVFLLKTGVFQTMDGAVYRLGVALHDLANPAKVLGVADDWILSPEDSWELTGYVHNVVFSCGAIAEDDGTVKIYWGGADSVMCVGTAKIEDLVALCRDQGRPPLT